MKRLYKSSNDFVFSGVFGGIGEYFGIDPVFLRVPFFLLTFYCPSVLLFYWAFALAMPEKGWK